MDKFITPCELPTPREREILTILIEEAAEVQQRATKMLRFGVAEVQPGQDQTNKTRLGVEVGDFLEMVEVAIAANLLHPAAIEAGREQKRAKLPTFMQTEQE